MRCILRLALALALAGCRADVEGWWSGEIGGEPRTLRLEQRGSTIEGEICSIDACAPLDGELLERRLELDFGCDFCAFPETSLDLELTHAGLEGDADVLLCRCEPGDEACSCRAYARFERCAGAC